MSEQQESRRAPRLPIKAQIRFKPVGEVNEAVSVDMSKTGIRFETDKPLRIQMEVTVGKNRDTYLARLVWAKRTESGGMTYGLEYESAE